MKSCAVVLRKLTCRSISHAHHNSKSIVKPREKMRQPSLYHTNSYLKNLMLMRIATDVGRGLTPYDQETSFLTP